MVFYRPSVLRGLAITQMVIGALMAVFGVACVFSVDNWTSYVAFGIWVGVWVLIGGILGYVGAKDDSRPNQSLIRCFLGFSVTACIFAGSMFSCYCIAVGGFGIKMRCKTYRGYSPNRRYQVYCYSSSERHKAAVGVGLGSCQLMFAIVECFVAILSSLYCLNAILGRPVSAQLPPAYSVQPAGASPVGMVAVSYAGATMPPQTQVQEPPKDHERPPPYAFTQGGNAPPSASASGAASAAGIPGVMEV